MTASPDERMPLTRGDLSGFPRPVQNVLLAAFRRGAGYRITDGTHILLFGSIEGREGTLKVSGSRQAEDSVRFVEKWLDANYPAVEKTRKLKVVNRTESPDGLRELPAGFRVFSTKRGVENDKIATNGSVYLCRVCGESMDTAVGASAHVRNGHEKGQTVERSNIEFVDTPAKPEEYLPEPEPPLAEILPPTDARVLQAIELLLEVANDDIKDVVADLEARNAALQAQLDECEARLALVRETLGM